MEETMTANKVRGFSFRYDDRPHTEVFQKSVEIREREKDQRYCITWKQEDGLQVMQTITEYREFGAVHWVLEFENKGTTDSGLISQVRDCDQEFALPDDPKKIPGYETPDGTAKVYFLKGSTWERDEFRAVPRELTPGIAQQCACLGGRSSDTWVPFFDINQGERGYLIAIGWTGQWNASFERTQHGVLVQTGLQELQDQKDGFILYPGEKVRTSSVLILPYDQGQEKAHNDFRRLMKKEFSLIGKPGRPQTGPLCFMGWGGLPSDVLIERIRRSAKYDLGYEYYWIDAGWYGVSENTQDCTDEFTGDWGLRTGDWSVNPYYHPDGLHEVVEEVERAGMKFLLWFEPERAVQGTPMTLEHPEWFLHQVSGDKNLDMHLILDLGNEDAWDYIYQVLCDKIETLHISCYRQDFNFQVLPYWQNHDTIHRKGIHEMKHIAGLYRLWDSLLERFPHLIIDNCASGGRRLDIEMLSRSISLWRSDFQCTWDADPEVAQIHSTGLSWYLPYHGTGAGKHKGDTYAFRSCFGTSSVNSFWGYAEGFGDEEPVEWVRKMNREFKKARPYFSCDFYSLAGYSVDRVSWTGWQYHDPDSDSGVVMAFRRSQSPNSVADFKLRGLLDGCVYRLEDADTGEWQERDGSGLMDMFRVTLPHPRSSKLFFYHVVQKVVEE